MIFNGVGVMLGSPDDKQPRRFVATKLDTLDASKPIQFDYSAENPIHGRDQVWDDLSLGFGQAIQQQDHERRYSYTLNADCSISGFWQKGPLITSFTPATKDSTHGIAKVLDYSGATYAVNGQYILVRADDTHWNVSKDLGAGNVATDAIVVKQPGSSTTYLLVGMVSGHIWYFDGATWTQHATLTGSYFTMYLTYLYMATAEYIRYVDIDSDPIVDANWAPASPGYSIGNSAYAIKGLQTVSNGGLLVVKEDGIYTLDANFIDRNLYPFLGISPTSTYPPCAANWMDDVFVGYQDACFRVHTDWSIEEVGPERSVNNDSPVHGRITSLVGHETFGLFAGVYNVDTSSSYLVKFGSWLNLREPPDWIAPQSFQAMRTEAWHGSLSLAFAGKWIQSMSKSTVGAPAGHSRLYIGFSDGSVAWFILACTPNPAACSSYVYSGDDGEIHLPRFTAMFWSEPKALKSATVSATVIDANHYVQLKYRGDDDTSFLLLGQDTTGFGTYGNLAQYKYSTLVTLTYAQLKAQASGADSWTQPHQIYDFPLQTGGRLYSFVVMLKSAVGVNGSPIVTGLAINYSVRPRLRRVYTFYVLADAKVARRDGSPNRVSRFELDQLVRGAVDSSGGIYLTLPTEEKVSVGVTGYEESTAYDMRLNAWRSAIKVTAADFQLQGELLPVIGTYKHLDQYTYGQLNRLTYGQFQRL